MIIGNVVITKGDLVDAFLGVSTAVLIDQTVPPQSASNFHEFACVVIFGLGIGSIMNSITSRMSGPK